MGDGRHRFQSAGDIEVLRWPGLDPLAAIVTTRSGGVSTGPYESLNLGLHVGDDPAAVVENRVRASAAIGLALDDLVFCNQAHGRVIAEVTAEDRGRGARSLDSAIVGADALVTTEPGVGLVVMVADCVPLVLHDPAAGVLACVHAGWRGTVARVGEAAVAAMLELGARAERIVAGVGPAIAPQDYQVGDDVVEAARDAFGEAAGRFIVPDGSGRWRFDLWTANIDSLTAAGVPLAQIHLAAVPTSDERFFSDRAVRPCGRFAAIAALPPQPA